MMNHVSDDESKYAVEHEGEFDEDLEGNMSEEIEISASEYNKAYHDSDDDGQHQSRGRKKDSGSNKRSTMSQIEKSAVSTFSMLMNDDDNKRRRGRESTATDDQKTSLAAQKSMLALMEDDGDARGRRRTTISTKTAIAQQELSSYKPASRKTATVKSKSRIKDEKKKVSDTGKGQKKTVVAKPDSKKGRSASAEKKRLSQTAATSASKGGKLSGKRSRSESLDKSLVVVKKGVGAKTVEKSSRSSRPSVSKSEKETTSLVEDGADITSEEEEDVQTIVWKPLLSQTLRGGRCVVARGPPVSVHGAQASVSEDGSIVHTAKAGNAVSVDFEAFSIDGVPFLVGSYVEVRGENNQTWIACIEGVTFRPDLRTRGVKGSSLQRRRGVSEVAMLAEKRRKIQDHDDVRIVWDDDVAHARSRPLRPAAELESLVSEKLTAEQEQASAEGRILTEDDLFDLRAQLEEQYQYIMPISTAQRVLEVPTVVEISLNWCYIPEDLPSGRLAIHGVREVFLTEHRSTVEPESIERRAVVLSEGVFRRLLELRLDAWGGHAPELPRSGSKRKAVPTVVPTDPAAGGVPLALNSPLARPGAFERLRLANPVLTPFERSWLGGSGESVDGSDEEWELEEWRALHPEEQQYRSLRAETSLHTPKRERAPTQTAPFTPNTSIMQNIDKSSPPRSSSLNSKSKKGNNEENEEEEEERPGEALRRGVHWARHFFDFRTKQFRKVTASDFSSRLEILKDRRRYLSASYAALARARSSFQPQSPQALRSLVDVQDEVLQQHADGSGSRQPQSAQRSNTLQRVLLKTGKVIPPTPERSVAFSPIAGPQRRAQDPSAGWGVSTAGVFNLNVNDPSMSLTAAASTNSGVAASGGGVLSPAALERFRSLATTSANEYEEASMLVTSSGAVTREDSLMEQKYYEASRGALFHPPDAPPNRPPSAESTLKDPELPHIDRFAVALERLRQSSVPSVLPGRDNERQLLLQILEPALLAGGLGGALYVSGTPGTGKTATFSEVVRILRARALAGELPDFRYVEVNAVKLVSPYQLYTVLHQALTGVRLPPAKACSALAKRFTGSGGQSAGVQSESKKKGLVNSVNGLKGHHNQRLSGMGARTLSRAGPIPEDPITVLLVDELDFCVTSKQSVLYNLFDWPTRARSRLIVVGIANTMDLPERLLPRVASRIGLARVVFTPYSARQVEAILALRLMGVGGPCFEPAALSFVAKKVANVSGDVRRALQICRRALLQARARFWRRLLAKTSSLASAPDSLISESSDGVNRTLFSDSTAQGDDDLATVEAREESTQGGSLGTVIAAVQRRLAVFAKSKDKNNSSFPFAHFESGDLVSVAEVAAAAQEAAMDTQLRRLRAATPHERAVLVALADAAVKTGAEGGTFVELYRRCRTLLRIYGGSTGPGGTSKAGDAFTAVGGMRVPSSGDAWNTVDAAWNASISSSGGSGGNGEENRQFGDPSEPGALSTAAYAPALSEREFLAAAVRLAQLSVLRLFWSTTGAPTLNENLLSAEIRTGKVQLSDIGFAFQEDEWANRVHSGA